MKQALNHGLVLKKVHRVIKFNHEVWLNHTLTWIQSSNKMQKWFPEKSAMLMNNAVFTKNKEIVTY